MDDVNERLKEDWKEETSPFERVKTVVTTTYEGESAAEIAADALVSETTARKHLEDLVEHGFAVKTSDPDRAATLYRRSEQSLILEEATDMLNRCEQSELTASVNRMERTLRSYREEYGAENPDEAVFKHDHIDDEELIEWRTTRRNLSFARVALALSMAENEVMLNVA